jgi:hypothetical protein
MSTFEYRLSPTRAQRQQLMAGLSESQAISNEMLKALYAPYAPYAPYAQYATFPTKYDLTARFKGRGSEHVPATTVQTLTDRLSKALNRYWQLKDRWACRWACRASRRPTTGTPFRCASPVWTSGGA